MSDSAGDDASEGADMVVPDHLVVDDGDGEPDDGDDVNDEDEDEDEDDIDDDEDDIDEDEDDDGDNGGQGRKNKVKVDSRRKKRSRAGSQFIQEEADVADDDDDHEDEDEDDDREIVEDVDVGEVQREIEARRAQRLAAMKQSEDLDEEAIAAQLDERYEHERDLMKMATGGDVAGGDHQQANLPTVHDPKLWLIRCKTGKEKSLVLSIMTKALHCAKLGAPLGIKSAFMSDNIKGFIYVEAFVEACVKDAVQGMSDVLHSKTKLVPVTEMVAAITVQKKIKSLKRGGWVRVKRGAYAGDAGRLIDVHEDRGKAIVKLVPRLDFDKLTLSNSIGEKRKRAVTSRNRPPPHLFNADDVRNMGGQVDRRMEGGSLVFVYDNQRFVDGYIHKELNIASIQFRGVKPTITELQLFDTRQDRASAGNDDLSILASADDGEPEEIIRLRIGDVVKVIDGDMKRLEGVVLSVNGHEVTMQPRHADLKEPLRMDMKSLVKHFTLGDHVKAISGRYEGETGLVLSISDGQACILSDVSLEQLKVLTKDIQISSDIAIGKDSLGNYKLYDLVSVSRTVAMVIAVEKDTLRVLHTDGHTELVKLSQVEGSRNFGSVKALDRNQREVGENDIVRVLEGAHKGRHGTVRHIYRSSLFLHSKEVLNDGGIYVVRSRNTEILGGLQRGGVLGNAKGAPASSMVPQSPARFGVPQSPSIHNAAGARPSPVMASFGRGRGRQNIHELFHKTVRAKSGPWKGFLGWVVEAGDATCRVELIAKNKIVSINTSNLVDVNKKGDENDSQGGRPALNTWSGYGADTGTPFRDSGGTPMHDGGGSTPYRDSQDVWNANVRNTPVREPNPSFGDYSSNPYTPSAYSAYNTTPGSSRDYPNSFLSPYTSSASPAVSYSASPYGGIVHDPYSARDSGYETMTQDTDIDAKWKLEGVEIVILDHGPYHTQHAVIRKMLGNGDIQVEVLSTDLLLPGGAIYTLKSGSRVERAPPQKGDRVLIFTGDQRGLVAQYVSREEEDDFVVMRLDNSNLVFDNINRLVKLAKVGI